MPSRSTINLRFPLAGLDRAHAYQHQPPYSTADCVNVRPDGTIEGRQRGGSRPGLSKAFQQNLGGPILMLDTVNVVPVDYLTSWRDEFLGDGLDSLVWGHAFTTTNGNPFHIPFPSVQDGHAFVVYPGAELGGAVRYALPIDREKTYTVRILLTDLDRLDEYSTFEICGGLPDLEPVDLKYNGFRAQLYISHRFPQQIDYGGRLRVYAGGQVVVDRSFLSGSEENLTDGWFTVTVLAGGNRLQCLWRDTPVLAAADVPQLVGTRSGFVINTSGEAPPFGRATIEAIEVDYYKEAAATITSPQPILIASAEGQLFQEEEGAMQPVAIDPPLRADGPVQTVQRLQKLFIADHETIRVEGTDGVVSDGPGDLFYLRSEYAGSWWLSGVVESDVCVLSNVSGGVVAGTYRIAAVNQGLQGERLELYADGVAMGPGTCAFKIVAGGGPRVYDPVLKTLERWQTDTYPIDPEDPQSGQPKGQVPTDCPLICRFKDRTVLAGANVWYMSRQGDPFDWDYSKADSQAAVAGPASEQGVVGDEIVALIPHSKDYLIFGCHGSFWVLRGDPGLGASLDDLSKDVGIVGPDAWCRDPTGAAWVLTGDGVYRIAPHADAVPESKSRERLPRDLVEAYYPGYTTLLAFDAKYRGIHIWRIGQQPRWHYWFDLETGGFWPATMQSGHRPLAAVTYGGETPSKAGVLLGCMDGYIRRYADENATDDGTAFNSHVLYGPIALSATEERAGIVQELIGVLDDTSGKVQWELLVGDTPEQARKAAPFRTGTWEAGLNYIVRPKARGGCFFLRLRNAESLPWAVESITAMRQQSGRLLKP